MNDARRLIADGTISGGMIPKVETSIVRGSRLAWRASSYLTAKVDTPCCWNCSPISAPELCSRSEACSPSSRAPGAAVGRVDAVMAVVAESELTRPRCVSSPGSTGQSSDHLRLRSEPESLPHRGRGGTGLSGQAGQ